MVNSIKKYAETRKLIKEDISKSLLQVGELKENEKMY